MGMDADVIGVGPLTQEILETNGLDYEKGYYEHVPIGTIITTTFFNCVTTDMSRRLADAFGIGYPADFSLHDISKSKKPFILTHADWEEIGQIARNEQPDEEAEAEIECFKTCWAAGWVLIYRPNF
jgi:hypothetical protein